MEEIEDIVDYSKKLDEECKKQRKNFIIIAIIAAFVAFSVGFYASYVLNKNSNEEGYKGKFDTIYSVLKDEWYYGIDDENIERTLIDKAIYGMLDTEKDPFTRYLTSLGSLADTYEGIGISIVEYKEYFVISEVAAQVNIDAGLKVGDILKAIDGVDLRNKTLDDVKSAIANKQNVMVTIQRGNAELEIKCYITRYSPVTVFKDFSSEEMAYIKISEFAADTGDYLEEYLKDAKEEGYTKLILDLRDNPGGYISSVVDCADLFLERGKTVLTTKNKKGEAYSYKTSSNDKYDFSKIIILINNNSASGAEALPAALNENLGDVVELVGVKTYGKGSAQKTMYFTDGTYFHYTYALWFTPNDNSIHKTGVSPEVAYTGSGIHLLDFAKVNLEKNAYGDYVYNLQIIMKELGYYTGELTRYYDDTLVNSMKSYQEDCGIEQTGKLDDLTIRYLLAKYYEDQVNDYRNEVDFVINEYGH